MCTVAIQASHCDTNTLNPAACEQALEHTPVTFTDGMQNVDDADAGARATLIQR